MKTIEEQYAREQIDLDSLFLKHGTDKGSDHHDYANWYERYLRRSRIGRFLEIGVASGASLNAWADWMPATEIHGVDVDLSPFRRARASNTTVWELDATDYLSAQKVPGLFDVIVDDGSHNPKDVVTIAAFWHTKLSPGGWYVVEDLGANDWLPVGEVIRTVRPVEAHLHGEILFCRRGESP